MNTQQSLDYLQAGLVCAGLRPDQIRTAMELARDTRHQTAPSASVYVVRSKLTRDGRKQRLTAEQLSPPVAGAVGGVRHSEATGLTSFEVTIAERSPADMQNLLAQFIHYLANTPFVDQMGVSFQVFKSGDELVIDWNDHDDVGQVIVTLTVQIPTVVWADHPLIPIEIVVQYRLDGGNPDE